MNFSPVSQNTIWNVQTRIREIDMALHPSVKSSLGEVRTFIYSTLAGCCDFLDSVQTEKYSSEVECFAKDVVLPIVEECFLEIEKYSFKLSDESLKLSLVGKLKKMQQYPKFNEFEEDTVPELIKTLEKVITTGKFAFYKLKETDSKYYGGIVHIDNKAFIDAVEIMEKARYKQNGDLIGSSLDVGGHVTTIFSKELSENYEHILNTHSEFISKNENASLKPISIKYGFPQSGILAKSVVITVSSPEIESYREACGLGKLFPAAHISIFSKVIQPLQELESKKVTFSQFINKETPFLSKLNHIFKSSL